MGGATAALCGVPWPREHLWPVPVLWLHSTHLISLFLGHSLTPTMTGLTDSGRRKQELRRACDSHLHFISGTWGPRTLQRNPSGPPCLSVEQH